MPWSLDVLGFYFSPVVFPSEIVHLALQPFDDVEGVPQSSGLDVGGRRVVGGQYGLGGGVGGEGLRRRRDFAGERGKLVKRT